MFAILPFWFIIQLFALAVLPLAWRWLRPLPSRGYALAKPLGLLLVTYVLWLGGSLGFLRNSAGGILFSLILVAAVSLWTGRSGLRSVDGRRPMLAWLRDNWRTIALIELLFLLTLAGWALVRSFSPEITTAGGEKFMELTFLNGILRSEQFPPQDPWLSGFAISYYYFGYVMLAALTRLSGLPASMAFNVGLATWFALTVTAAFGVAYDMVAALFGRQREGLASGGRRAATAGGLLGALFVGLLGNLAGFLESMQGLGLGSLAFWRWLDVKDLNCLGGPNFTEAIANCPSASGIVPDRFFWWWRASRVINDRDLLGNAVEVIDEFPFFSFLLGDMHPHVLALPFVLLAVGLALAIVLAGRGREGEGRRERGVGRREEGSEASTAIQDLTSRLRAILAPVGDAFPLGWAGYLLAALCLGGLAFLNTWDFPIYVFLVTLAVALRLAWDQGWHWGVAGRALLAGLGLGLLGGLLYLPFYVGFQSQAGGILPNFIFPTRLSQFFVMFGPLLVAAFLLLLALTANGRATLRAGLPFLPWTIGLPLLFLLVILALGALTGVGQEAMRRLVDLPAIRQQVGDATLGQLAGEVLKLRLLSPWTYLLLAGLLAWVLGLLSQAVGLMGDWKSEIGNWKLDAEDSRSPIPDSQFPIPNSQSLPPSSSLPAPAAFALLALLTALLLAFSVEFVYLRDTFGTRMNTVFKFYYQAWVLLALVAAFGVVYVARSGRRLLRLAGLPLIALLVVAGLFYPALATVARAERFATQPTLDGTAYLAQQNPADAAAVAWLQANVPGNATILEAPGDSYRYAGRISAQTGLPTLLGWEGHELQWRGDSVEQGKRRPDIQRIYAGAPVAELVQLLDKWQIDYVVIGALERSAYGVTPQSEARLAQLMDLVYDVDGVRIYRRRA